MRAGRACHRLAPPRPPQRVRDAPRAGGRRVRRARLRRIRAGVSRARAERGRRDRRKPHGRESAAGRAAPPGRRAAERGRAARPRAVLRSRAVRVGPAIVCVVPQPRSCVRPAERSGRATGRRRADAARLSAAAVADVSVPAAELQHRPGLVRERRRGERRATGRIRGGRRARAEERRRGGRAAARAAGRDVLGRPRGYAAAAGVRPVDESGRDGEREHRRRRAQARARALRAAVPAVVRPAHLRRRTSCGVRSDVRDRALPGGGPVVPSVFEQVRPLARRPRAAHAGGAARHAALQRSEQGELRGLPPVEAERGRSAADVHRFPVRGARRAAQTAMHRHECDAAKRNGPPPINAPLPVSPRDLADCLIPPAPFSSPSSARAAGTPPPPPPSRSASESAHRARRA